MPLVGRSSMLLLCPTRRCSVELGFVQLFSVFGKECALPEPLLQHSTRWAVPSCPHAASLLLGTAGGTAERGSREWDLVNAGLSDPQDELGMEIQRFSKSTWLD